VREFEGVRLLSSALPAGNIADFTSRSGVDIQDPCVTAARLIPKIHAAGAQVIVALTHQTIGDDKEFARCSGVDVVIGGHEAHAAGIDVRTRPIFKMDADARELGRIDLNISRTTGKLESIDWKIIPVDRQVQSDRLLPCLKAGMAR